MNRLHPGGPAAYLVLAGLAWLLGGCATNPVTGKTDLVLMSEEQEISLGETAHGELLKRYRVYDHPPLQAYIAELGQKIASRSHRSHLEYRFTLLDSPEVNAFALPGGYIYVTRGILAYMNSEEALAGVLGHELGHVTARHGVRQHSARVLAGVAGAIVSVATQDRQATRVSDVISSAMVRGYGRSHELEADRLGAQYLALSGYDPQQMLDVIGILKDQEAFEIQRAEEEGRPPRVYHGLFSTHPRNDARLREVIEAAAQFAVADAEHTDPERFLRLQEGMLFGESEDQGIVRKHRFYHKPLDVAIAFPEGWTLRNGTEELVGTRKDGGAMVVVRMDTLAEGEGPGRYLSRAFGQVRNLEERPDGQYTGLVAGNTSYGARTVRVSARRHGADRVFLFAGFSRSGRPDEAVFATAGSVRALSDAEQHLAAARRIHLVRARPGDTFAGFAADSSLDDWAEEQLRLLNGMYPDGEPGPGQLIKTIR